MRPVITLFSAMAFWWLAPMVDARAQAALIGACRFNPATFSFDVGDALSQTRCLLRPVLRYGAPGPDLAALPPTLAGVLGRPFGIDRETAGRVLRSGGLDASVASTINTPISAGGVQGSAPARYFVIHDTSTPYLGDDDFPADLDNAPQVNTFAPYQTGEPVAHMFVNRAGDLFVGHDFGEPWRATKVEKNAYGGEATRGLFVHVELLQPRRRDANGGPRNDAIAPDPGFSSFQYQRLAQLYVLASARAGAWLVPAFHANVDRGIPDAHDDPQNFDLIAFDDALARLLSAMHSAAQPQTQMRPPDSDPRP